VAAAILMDAEARRGDSPTTTVATDGKLREPIVMMVGLARAFHATTDGTGFTGYSGNMSQPLFNSGSVFNFFPPQSLIPGTTLNGPEFAIFNTASSLNRVNFVNTFVYGQISGTTTVNFTPVINAGSPAQMVTWLNNLFLHGTMSGQMNTSIATALGAAVAPVHAFIVQPVEAQNAPSAVAIDNFTFNPQQLTIKAGTTVTWTNKDDIPHAIAAVNKQFKSKALDTDDAYSFTFAHPRHL